MRLHYSTRKLWADDLRDRTGLIACIFDRCSGLDFVLAHQQCDYLETEGENLRYFCDELNIDRKLLPSRRYSGAIKERKTDRYFVDKFPIQVATNRL